MKIPNNKGALDYATDWYYKLYQKPQNVCQSRTAVWGLIWLFSKYSIMNLPSFMVWIIGFLFAGFWETIAGIFSACRIHGIFKNPAWNSETVFDENQ